MQDLSFNKELQIQLTNILKTCNNIFNKDYIPVLYNAINFTDFFNNNEFITENFIKLILTNNEIIKNLFLKNELYIFKIISFAKNNQSYITYLNSDINLYTNKNLKQMELIWNQVNKSICVNLPIEISFIELNMDTVFYYINVYIWMSLIDEIPNTYNPHQLNFLIKQIILEYYHLKLNDFNFSFNVTLNFFYDESIYQEYQKFIIKYTDIYTSIDKFNINFKNFEDILFDTYKDDFKNLFFSFLKYCVKNKCVNKYLIEWIYIIFCDELDADIKNDLLFLILDIKKNLIKIVMKIFNFFNIDFYKINTDELKELLIKLQNKYDYLGKMSDNLNYDNLDLENIINNINLIKGLNQKSENYNFLNNYYIEQEDFFIFLSYSPLVFDLNDIKINSKKINFKDNLNKYISIFNSINLMSFKDYHILIDQTSTNKVYVEIIDLKNEDFKIENYNQNIILYKFIEIFLEHDILLNKDISLYKNIQNHKFDLLEIIDIYNNIYPNKNIKWESII